MLDRIDDRMREVTRRVSLVHNIERAPPLSEIVKDTPIQIGLLRGKIGVEEPLPTLERSARTGQAFARKQSGEFLTAFENAYGDQLHRYYATLEPSAENLPSQQPLNYDDNEPF